MDAKELIARRIALELKSGDLVNLGIGLPAMVTHYLPPGVDVFFQLENGLIGLAPLSDPGLENYFLGDAGGALVSAVPGACAFDSAFSFGLIRGGHVDLTVLGGLEVDERGLLANWMVPGKMVPGMGGAMDLVAGARRIIAILLHTDKTGEAKVLKRCTLPLTGKGAVDVIITDKAVFQVAPEGLVLTELAEGMTLEGLKAITQAEFSVAPELRAYRLA